MTDPRLASRGTHVLLMLLVAGGAMEAGFFSVLVDPPRPGSTAPFLARYLAIFAVYAFAVRLVLRPQILQPRAERAAGAAILALACLFRATFLGGSPALSSDLYRYRWDGRVLLAGGNPYRDPPDVPSLAGLRDAFYPRMEHTEVRTIYPPAAQLLFAAGAALSSGLGGIKTLLILADLLVLVLLRRILALRGVPPLRILLYAWNPLAVIEVAWSGHLEPAGVACVLLAAVSSLRGGRRIPAYALALGGLVKVVPWALFVPFWRSLGRRSIVLAPLLAVAAYWPFRGAGARLLEGLRAYAGNWSGNASLFGAIEAALVWIDPTPALKATIALARGYLPGSGPLDHLYPYVYPPDLARALGAVLALAFGFVLARRGIEPLRGSYLLTGLILLLSPTLHPWYLLWLLPWLCLFPSRPWILLSGLVALSYADLGAPGPAAPSHSWVRWVEYIPFYLGLLAPPLIHLLRRGRGGTAVVPSPGG